MAWDKNYSPCQPFAFQEAQSLSLLDCGQDPEDLDGSWGPSLIVMWWTGKEARNWVDDGVKAWWKTKDHNFGATRGVQSFESV